MARSNQSRLCILIPLECSKSNGELCACTVYNFIAHNITTFEPCIWASNPLFFMATAEGKLLLPLRRKYNEVDEMEQNFVRKK